MDLQLALDAGGWRQPCRVEGFHGREVLALVLELAEDGIAAAVTEEVVIVVEADRGGEDRVVAKQPDETGLDEIVELVVAWPGGRRGLRARERSDGSWLDHLGMTSGAPGLAARV